MLFATQYCRGSTSFKQCLFFVIVQLSPWVPVLALHHGSFSSLAELFESFLLHSCIYSSRAVVLSSVSHSLQVKHLNALGLRLLVASLGYLEMQWTGLSMSSASSPKGYSRWISHPCVAFQAVPCPTPRLVSAIVNTQPFLLSSCGIVRADH